MTDEASLSVLSTLQSIGYYWYSLFCLISLFHELLQVSCGSSK